MKVVWTETAISHLQTIHDYIAQNSTVYAVQVVDRITQRSEQSRNFQTQGEWFRNFVTRLFVK